ncbi:MAG: hypothetical protein FWD35_05765 [Oscillospiraceae bacterium]|nr:hypothetical protein [Oscillospiraceae bacterium]
MKIFAQAPGTATKLCVNRMAVTVAILFALMSLSASFFYMVHADTSLPNVSAVNQTIYIDDNSTGFTNFNLDLRSLLPCVYPETLENVTFSAPTRLDPNDLVVLFSETQTPDVVAVNATGAIVQENKATFSVALTSDNFTISNATIVFVIKDAPVRIEGVGITSREYNGSPIAVEGKATFVSLFHSSLPPPDEFDTRYEFSELGSEVWGEIPPTQAGRYLFRVTAELEDEIMGIPYNVNPLIIPFSIFADPAATAPSTEPCTEPSTEPCSEPSSEPCSEPTTAAAPAPEPPATPATTVRQSSGGGGGGGGGVIRDPVVTAATPATPATPASTPATPAFTNYTVTVNREPLVLYNAEIPAQAIIIMPEGKGELGQEIKVRFTAAQLREAEIDSRRVSLFYISSDGVVTDLGQPHRTASGAIEFSFTRASFYVLAETAPVGITRILLSIQGRESFPLLCEPCEIERIWRVTKLDDNSELRASKRSICGGLVSELCCANES